MCVNHAKSHTSGGSTEPSLSDSSSSLSSASFSLLIGWGSVRERLGTGDDPLVPKANHINTLIQMMGIMIIDCI